MTSMIDVRRAKVHTRHNARTVSTFVINGEIHKVINTKHGVYRILNEKNLKLSDLGKLITSIGIDEIKRHFEIAETHFDGKMSWERQIDYVLSIYDMKNEMVLMVGLHPHLKRITIVTVIPRVKRVASNNVYGVYRIDTKDTVDTYIEYTIPDELEMEYILI